jgi:hypothetical protein
MQSIDKFHITVELPIGVFIPKNASLSKTTILTVMLWKKRYSCLLEYAKSVAEGNPASQIIDKVNFTESEVVKLIEDDEYVARRLSAEDSINMQNLLANMSEEMRCELCLSSTTTRRELIKDGCTHQVCEDCLEFYTFVHNKCLICGKHVLPVYKESFSKVHEYQSIRYGFIASFHKNSLSVIQKLAAKGGPLLEGMAPGVLRFYIDSTNLPQKLIGCILKKRYMMGKVDLGQDVRSFIGRWLGISDETCESDLELLFKKLCKHLVSAEQHIPDDSEESIELGKYMDVLDATLHDKFFRNK